jgi:glycosyltransferase involved in cell wall biosynthesis
VHLHGLASGLLGIFAAKFRSLQAPLHLTLYGAGAWRLPSSGLLWLMRRCVPRVEAILPGRPGVPLPPAQIDIVAGTVDEVFYAAARREARLPLVVATSGQPDARAAARFAQLAVLLHDAPQPPGFNWIGPADATSTAQLSAAGVGQFDAPDAVRRAARLRSAWLYVAAGDAGGFPVGLVEAMALGLPCVAWATPSHRAVIRHGETGLLCESADELLTCVANLVDSPTYRTRLGTAARLEALQRFHPVGLGNALLASYQAAAAPPHVDAGAGAVVATAKPQQQLLPVDR